MRRKQACRGRGRPRKKPNVVSERLVSERVVSEKVVNEKEGAFLNFVSQNIEGNDIVWNQSDDEDHNDEEFNPEMEIDSGNSSASSMGSDWSYGDQNVSSVDRTVQRLIRKYGEVNLQIENSSKKIDVAQTKPLQVFGSWSRFQHEQEAPSHDPRCNKKELSASLSVIKRVMKMDAAVPFNIPVDPIALRLHSNNPLFLLWASKRGLWVLSSSFSSYNVKLFLLGYKLD
ncbi:uncharacterized protein Pyn_28777 [Prunus yedoensis var. nudiflora]|uniref:Uncharacterized protein n=1 Tax=Prunus yedoensis var. nudiflora TaxID=2094558 RepID=A0A314Z7A9_PRUYE|nr:uncharacterized protein Pyn_28777 [Prunus yedoensis var. nudiflora]